MIITTILPYTTILNKTKDKRECLDLTKYLFLPYTTILIKNKDKRECLELHNKYLFYHILLSSIKTKTKENA